METYWLTCHPDTPQSALADIRVGIARRGDACLSVSFRATGRIEDVAWPGSLAMGYDGWQRADGLWMHSCFEIFCRPEGGQAYAELNFATSARWAAYGFKDYRAGMVRLDDIVLHSASWQIQSRRASLDAVVRLPLAYSSSAWEAGVSAVIEARDGARSYWALAHPPGEPDFHHPACFAAALAPPSGT